MRSFVKLTFAALAVAGTLFSVGAQAKQLFVYRGHVPLAYDQFELLPV
jgi:hypothetical protein